MDSRSHRSSGNFQDNTELASLEGQSTPAIEQHKTVTSKHGLSHRVTIEKSIAASSYYPAKVRIESNINLAIDSRYRLCVEDDDGDTLPPEQEWRVRQNYRDEMLSMLRDVCTELNSPLQQILNVHLMTPAPDKEPTPDSLFEPFSEASPAEPFYEQKNWTDKLFPWRAKAINQRNDALADQFHRQQNIWEKKASQHKENYLTFWNNRLVTAGNTEVFLRKLLDQAPCNIEAKTDLSVNKTSSTVWLDTHFPEIKTLPGLEYKVLEKELRLTCKSLSPTKKRQCYMQQVHSIGFRLIGEVFAAVPALQQVALSGFSKRLNPATAHLQQDYLYSVKVTRAQWQGINFLSLSDLSLVEVMAGFELRRNMSKTGIFKTIEPFSKVQAQQSDIFTAQDVAS